METSFRSLVTPPAQVASMDIEIPITRIVPLPNDEIPRDDDTTGLWGRLGNEYWVARGSVRGDVEGGVEVDTEGVMEGEEGWDEVMPQYGQPMQVQQPEPHDVTSDTAVDEIDYEAISSALEEGKFEVRILRVQNNDGEEDEMEEVPLHVESDET